MKPCTPNLVLWLGVVVVCFQCRCAVDAFRELLKANECDVLLSTMGENDVDNLVGTENTLPHGMLFIARYNVICILYVIPQA